MEHSEHRHHQVSPRLCDEAVYRCGDSAAGGRRETPTGRPLLEVRTERTGVLAGGHAAAVAQSHGGLAEFHRATRLPHLETLARNAGPDDGARGGPAARLSAKRKI